jgi:HSP20 family protein
LNSTKGDIEMFRMLTPFEGTVFDNFRRLEREMDQLFGSGPSPNGIRSMARGTYPPINVGSTPNQVDVYLFAAGVDPASLDISIQQNLLTIAGERKASPKEGMEFFRKERFDGDFRRTLSLPDDVDPDQVDASYKDGLLQITVKRREEVKPRQIEIK